MPKFYPFPHIDQFHNMIRAVKETVRFIGCDELTGKPQYDSLKPLPLVEFYGTVKVHGTNAGIGYDPQTGELWAQSRNHVLSDKSDNCGFHTFVMLNKDLFISILSKLTTDKPIVAFGEWFGSGIQKNVAVADLRRRLMIFAIKIITDDKNPIWLDRSKIEHFYSPENFIFNAYTTFPTYKIVIDFNTPELAQNLLVELTEKVEKECPIGKYFGKSGIGEGIVWSSEEFGRFKVKGDEHSSSKTTTLAAIDVEKLASVKAFVDYAVTENRLNQGIEQVFTIQGLTPTPQKTRDFITWIAADVLKEESFAMTENKLIPEEVGKAVADKARQWYNLFIKK
jgi:hypothetical protein